ncbi:MAG: hypothetical protein JWN67_4719 [Actinomycetia bacterium]|nr:hypothetical protein [Actinomycetes bacterium]
MHDDAPVTAAAPTADVRKWVGAGIGIVAIALAALIGTGIISSDASTGGQGGRGGFGGFGGNGGPPGLNGGGQLNGGQGGFRGGFPGGGQGGFTGGPPQFGGGQQQLAPSTPSTTVPQAKATLS